MQETTKNAGKVNNSNRTGTPAGAKSVERQAQQRSLTEQLYLSGQAANQANLFILSHGLLDQFTYFCQNYHSDDYHADCVKLLAWMSCAENQSTQNLIRTQSIE